MRVLVVEDEKRLAAGLKKGLEAEGFATDVALNGTDGLWMAREHPYGAIVLDIMLPGINGFKVCATLREEGIWIPILMLTAKYGELDEAEALDTGADDYLTKPFSYVVLMARLCALVRRGARERPAVLEAGDLRFDPGSRRAWREVTGWRRTVAKASPGFPARLRARAGTVRVRTTGAAVIVVGATLVVASVAMVVFLRRSLTADVRGGALLRAEAVAGDLATRNPGNPIPVGDDEDEFVQVLAADGQVVNSSDNLKGQPAVARLESGEALRIENLPFEDDLFLVVATSAATPRGPVTVIVGRTLETVTESTETVVGLLATGVPLLLVVMGAVTWQVVGRALAPVDSMRAEVEAISSRELHRRVPDPPGKDEVARLATTMNRMLARLQEGQSRQRRFVSDASHELRSPVAAIRQHAEVALIVDDDGDGIPGFERLRVFERFVRLEEARDRDSGGSGLGLAIVAEIAAAHGGAVAVRDTPLGGARLEVRFPSPAG